MVWGIAFGELLCGGLWGVFCGYVGMRTHFLSINPRRGHLGEKKKTAQRECQAVNCGSNWVRTSDLSGVSGTLFH